MSDEFPDVPPQEPRIVQTGLDLSVDLDEVDWDESDVGLPDGAKSKVIYHNEAEQRRDVIVKNPPGYVEPRHTHEAAHACLVLDGRMLVDGRELTPGDYVYGQKLPHGPFEFPDGVVNFVSLVGGSPTHVVTDD